MASKITNEERKALKWVRSALSKKSNLKPIDDHISVDRCLKNDVIPAKLFRMEMTCEESMCGTVGCIGGWMGLKMSGGNVDFARKYVGDNHSQALYDLFYDFDPSDWDENAEYNGVSRATAIKAIDRVLAGKYENPWKYAFKNA